MSTEIKRITHLVGGGSWTGVAERTGKVYNPATGEVPASSTSPRPRPSTRSSRSPTRRSGPGRRRSLTRRTQVLFAFRELLNQRKEELAALITSEHGKVLVRRGRRGHPRSGGVEFACGIPHLLKGGYSENVSTKVDVYSIRQPLGVVAVISPFNFPAMVPMWFVPIAIACGNTCGDQAEREGPVGGELRWPSCGRRPVCRTAC